MSQDTDDDQYTDFSALSPNSQVKKQVSQPQNEQYSEENNTDFSSLIPKQSKSSTPSLVKQAQSFTGNGGMSDEAYADVLGGSLGALYGYKASGAGITPLSTSFMRPSQAASAQSRWMPTPNQPTFNQFQQSGQGVPTPDQTQRILEGNTGDLDTTGRQRQTGYTAETQRLSRAQQLNEANIKQLQRSGVIASADPLATSPQMTATRSGIQIPVSAANDIATAQANVNASRQAAQAAQEAQNAAQAARAAKITGALSRYAPIAEKTLSGLGFGGGIADTLYRLSHGDRSGATISGLTTAGSLIAPELAIPAGIAAQYIHDNGTIPTAPKYIPLDYGPKD